MSEQPLAEGGVQAPLPHLHQPYLSIMADQPLVIAGRNPVREALQRGDVQIEKVLIQQGTRGKAIDDVRRAAERAQVPVQFVPAQRLDKLGVPVPHQGVVALSAPVGYVDVDEMLARIAPDRDALRERQPLLLLLDEIQDPHNFGAILRSAVAFGAAGVIVPQHRMAPLGATAVKASAGAALRIPVARVTNLADTIAALKERGYWVAGAAGGGELSAWDLDWQRPLALVIGSEGSGMRPRVADACDHRIHIPMPGPMESLNASVAAGVLLAVAAHARTA